MSPLTQGDVTLSAPPAASPAVAPAPQRLPASAFLKSLVTLMRAHDRIGAWEGIPDAALLADYILDKERRRSIPIIGDPSAQTLWRLDLFYAAVGLAIERQTGVIASPLMKISSEGFGRVVLTAGRLIVVDRYLRDVHRFGFSSLDHLVAEGEKLVAAAATTIRRFPDVVGATDE
jgi:probable nitrogen fixation protein